MHRKIEDTLERIFIVILLILSVYSILFEIDPDVEVIMKILSLSSLGYLFYRLSFMRIFFGKKRDSHLSKNTPLLNLHFDMVLLFFFMCLTANDFIEFLVNVEGQHLLYEVAQLLSAYRIQVEMALFMIGSLGITIMSVYLGTRIHFSKPSMIALFHEEGFPKNLRQGVLRVVSVFLMLNSFYLFYFSMISEWFALTLERPVTLLGFFAAFYLITNRHFGLLKDIDIITKSGEMIRNFFEEKLPEMMHTHKITYVVSGMLVLSLLTDMMAFVIPFLFKIQDSYIHQIMSESTISTRPTLMSFLKASSSFPEMIVYVLVTAGLLLALCVPAYFWWLSLTSRRHHFSRIMMSVYIALLFVLTVNPLLTMEPITGTNLIGTDFKILSRPGMNADFIFMGALIIFFSAYKFGKKILIPLGQVIVFVFIGQYVMHTVTSIWGVYSVMIQNIVGVNLFIGLYLTVFLLLSLVIYPLGYLLFIYQQKYLYNL